MKISKHRTLFIFDWDDTLFPTNWVMKNGINLNVSSSRDQYTIYFQELDRALSKCLKNAMKLGKVIIVTNALPEWIQLSSVVLPQTYNLLRKVKIISARYKYRKATSNMAQWKIMAFRDIIDVEFENISLTNVISVGDAEYEYQALIALNKEKTKTPKYLKSIKFLRDPTHDILIEQLDILNSAMIEIWNIDKHLDLKLDNQKNRQRKSHRNN